MIQDGLQSLRRGRTTLLSLTAFQPSAAPIKFSCLEAGEIFERGTHEELLAAGGRYKQLYDKQYRFERNQFINPGEDFTPEVPKPLPAHRTRRPCQQTFKKKHLD